MEFDGPANAVNLKTFLQCYGSALPIAVNIVEGYFGPDVDETLEVDHVLVIYKVEKEKMIVAIDQFNRELCVPKNSKTKIQLIPSGCHKKYCSIRELCTGYQTKNFRVLEDIPSVGINSETTLIILKSDKFHSNLVKCLISRMDSFEEVLLPLELSGTFQPLLGAREYQLEEVMANYPLPVSVRFVSLEDDYFEACTRHLSNLGNIDLRGEREVEMVFAASIDNLYSLSVFPKTLDIKVGCGFKVTEETSEKIKHCRQHLAVSEKALDRLDRLKANSFYFTTYPVIHFNLELLQSPSLSKPEKTENKTLVNKTNERTEGLCVNTKLETERKYGRSGSSSQSSSEAERNYENFEIDKKLNDKMSKAYEEAHDAVFNLHHKMSHNARSTPHDVTQHTTSYNARHHAAHDVTEESHPLARRRPIPTPRKRVGTGNEVPGDNNSNVVDPSPKTQIYHFSDSEWSLLCRSSSEDDSDDACPELPPKHEFLRKTSSPPPPLPPRTPPCGEGLAYLVTDVTDWKGVEQRHLRTTKRSPAIKQDALDASNDDYYIDVIADDVYTEVKDDGRVFRLADLEPNDQSFNYSLETEEVYIFMEDQRGKETDGIQPNVENFQEEYYLEPVDMRVPEDAPIATQETERAGDTVTQFEKRRLDCVTINGDIENRGSSRTDMRKKNSFPQKAEGTDNTDKNSWSKHSQPCGFPAAEQTEMPRRTQTEENIIISPRREDDFVDFGEIQKYLDRLKGDA